MPNCRIQQEVIELVSKLHFIFPRSIKHSKPDNPLNTNFNLPIVLMYNPLAKS